MVQKLAIEGPVFDTRPVCVFVYEAQNESRAHVRLIEQHLFNVERTTLYTWMLFKTLSNLLASATDMINVDMRASSERKKYIKTVRQVEGSLIFTVAVRRKIKAFNSHIYRGWYDKRMYTESLLVNILICCSHDTQKFGLQPSEENNLQPGLLLWSSLSSATSSRHSHVSNKIKINVKTTLNVEFDAHLQKKTRGRRSIHRWIGGLYHCIQHDWINFWYPWKVYVTESFGKWNQLLFTVSDVQNWNADKSKISAIIQRIIKIFILLRIQGAVVTMTASLEIQSTTKLTFFVESEA